MKKFVIFMFFNLFFSNSYGGVLDSLNSMLKGETEITMKCRGTLSISNTRGVINSVPTSSTIKLTVVSDSKSLTKKISLISIDGKSYQVCKQDNTKVVFLENCSKDGPQTSYGEGGSNNFTNHFNFNKSDSSLTMNTIYRNGDQFISDKESSMKCE